MDFGISLSPIAVTLFSRLCDTLVSHGGITALRYVLPPVSYGMTYTHISLSYDWDRLVNCGLNEESIRLLTEALARPGLQSIKVLEYVHN